MLLIAVHDDEAGVLWAQEQEPIMAATRREADKIAATRARAAGCPGAVVVPARSFQPVALQTVQRPAERVEPFDPFAVA